MSCRAVLWGSDARQKASGFFKGTGSWIVPFGSFDDAADGLGVSDDEAVQLPLRRWEMLLLALDLQFLLRFLIHLLDGGTLISRLGRLYPRRRRSDAR